MEDGLNLTIYENAFDSPEEIFQRLEKEIVYLPEEQCQIRIKNKSLPISRKIVAYGDPDLSYTFSGLTLTTQPWIPLLLEMKNLVEGILETQFNFVLVNRYENGNAYIGQHKDNEADLDENTCICSISFGETRSMIFKRPGYENKEIKLKSNSILVMKPPTNELWSHGIPKQKKRTGVRINLTFRKMKTSAQDLNKNKHAGNKNKHADNKRKHADNKRKLDQLESNKDKKRKKTEPMNATFRRRSIESRGYKEYLGKEKYVMEYLGRENFVTVNHFLHCAQVSIRRFVRYEYGYSYTEDGVSLSPQVWHALCRQLNSIYCSTSTEQVHVIERDVCISKQMKDGLQVFVFQRLLQTENLCMQIVPEHIVLYSSEMEKLIDVKRVITKRLKDGLITHNLEHHLYEELKNRRLELKPDYNYDNFSQLLGSLSQCLLDAIKPKISELLNCVGCRESYETDFMHECKMKSPSEKWSDYFDLALYLISLKDVAKNIVQKNLTTDFDVVLSQEEFFDALDVKKLFESMEKMYVADEETEKEEITSTCHELCTDLAF